MQHGGAFRRDGLICGLGNVVTIFTGPVANAQMEMYCRRLGTLHHRQLISMLFWLRVSIPIDVRYDTDNQSTPFRTKGSLLLLPFLLLAKIVFFPVGPKDISFVLKLQ